MAPDAAVAPATTPPSEADVLHGARPSRQRVAFLDASRAVAIALATVSHGYRAFTDPSGFLGHPLEKYLYLAARAATPLFLVLFGMMVEWVYVRRAKSRGLGPVAGQMLKRSAQCYAGFLIIAAGAAVGTGRVSVLTDAVWMATTPGNSWILKFYVVAIPVSIALVALRLRVGVWGIVGVAVVAWLADAPAMWIAERVPMGPFSDLLLGAGGGGLSVRHSLAFVAIGAVLATSLLRDRERGGAPTVSFMKTGGLVLLGCGLAVVLAAALGEDMGSLPNRLVNGTLRGDNDILYIVLGTALALPVMIGLAALEAPLQRGGVALRVFVALGVSSLVAYAGGNALLNALRGVEGMATDEFGLAVAMSLAFVALLAVAVWAFDAARRRTALPKAAPVDPALHPPLG